MAAAATPATAISNVVQQESVGTNSSSSLDDKVNVPGTAHHVGPMPGAASTLAIAVSDIVPQESVGTNSISSLDDKVNVLETAHHVGPMPGDVMRILVEKNTFLTLDGANEPERLLPRRARSCFGRYSTSSPHPTMKVSLETHDKGASFEEEVEGTQEPARSATEMSGGAHGAAKLAPDATIFKAIVGNIPTHCKAADFDNALHAMGFGSQVLSWYVPLRTNKDGRILIKGFAFVHFAERDTCERFVHAAWGFTFTHHKSEKRLSARLAVESMN